MFKIVYKLPDGGKTYWIMEDPYRKLMNKYFGVSLSNDSLDAKEEDYEFNQAFNER